MIMRKHAASAAAAGPDGPAQRRPARHAGVSWLKIAVDPPRDRPTDTPRDRKPSRPRDRPRDGDADQQMREELRRARDDFERARQRLEELERKLSGMRPRARGSGGNRFGPRHAGRSPLIARRSWRGRSDLVRRLAVARVGPPPGFPVVARPPGGMPGRAGQPRGGNMEERMQNMERMMQQIMAPRADGLRRSWRGLPPPAARGRRAVTANRAVRAGAVSRRSGGDTPPTPGVPPPPPPPRDRDNNGER